MWCWWSVKEMNDECIWHSSLHSDMVLGVVVVAEKEGEASRVDTHWKQNVVARCGNI